MSTELDVLKNNVVTQMFVDTADQNYLIARWAYHREIFLDFFWNSVHALEKYLKASLLLNGRSSIGNQAGQRYQHNLNLLFAEVGMYAGDLFPAKLVQPKQLNYPKWREETPAEFITRFDGLGNANNRYNVFGYTQRWEDLHHLDQIVFYTRRIAFNLNAYPFLGHAQNSDTVPKTVRELLGRSATYCPRTLTSRLHKLLDTEGSDELRDAGLKFNFQFAPEGYDHSKGESRVVSSTSISVLYRRIVARAESTSHAPGDQVAAELADWVLENIFLPRSVKDELQDHAEGLRSRSP